MNQPVWLGLTPPQLWSVALVAAGALTVVRTGRRPAVPA